MIDDVTYLKENAEKDSQIVYIDSSLRNKLYYPNSNEYTIDFDQPFKLVYGFDVMDASVPVTMYNVDQYNNTLYYSVVKKNPGSLTPIDPVSYFSEISNCSSFIEIYERDTETYIAIGQKSILEGYIAAITVPNPNYVMYLRSTIDTIEIIPKKRQVEDEFYFFTYKNGHYCIRTIPENTDIINILKTGDYSLSFDGSGTTTVVQLVKYEIDLNIFTAINAANAFTITISNLVKSLEIGNYDVLTIVNDLNDLMNPAIDVLPTTAVPKKQGKLMFESTYFILLNAGKGELIKSLGFDTYPAATSSGTNYQGWTIGSNYLVFGSVFNSVTGKYTVISPGLISLLGERFAILRIKEIEDSMYGSYSYMAMTPGIGMFKMAAGFGGITNLRFDYTTYIKKPFHPIGKLSRLSIRFETASGRLYDFKGVNHQLMINIKFYSPTNKMTFSRSILNPNYKPNLMEYMATENKIEEKEQEENDEDDDIEDYAEYQKQQDKYDYSSSGEENDDEESAEESSDESEEELDNYTKYIMSQRSLV